MVCTVEHKAASPFVLLQVPLVLGNGAKQTLSEVLTLAQIFVKCLLKAQMKYERALYSNMKYVKLPVLLELITC